MVFIRVPLVSNLKITKDIEILVLNPASNFEYVAFKTNIFSLAGSPRLSQYL